MNPSRKFDWLRIGKVYIFSSNAVFRDIKPPDTPILVPLSFVAIVTAAIMWVVVPIVVTQMGIEREVKSGWWFPHRLSLLQWEDWVQHLLRVPFAALRYVLDVIWLGTYFFVIARCFRIDDIRWEHWFGFAWWTLLPFVLVEGAAVLIEAYTGSMNPSLTVGVLVVGLCFLLPIVWTAVLTVHGLRIWTQKGWAYCLGFGLLPYFLLVLVFTPDIVRLFIETIS